MGLNAVRVHTELNGTSGSMLSQMLKGTPCILRFSPCFKGIPLKMKIQCINLLQIHTSHIVTSRNNRPTL